MSYIKLDRKMKNWEWFTEPLTAHLFIYILLSANHEAKSWQGIKVDRGCFITSEAKMAAETGLTRQQLRTSIKRLEITKEITKISTKTYSLIKVNKFSKYQGYIEESNQEDNQDVNHQLTTGITTTKEYKEYKEVNSNGIYSEVVECSPEFTEALKEFEKFRKLIKKPLTEEAKKRMLKKLKDLAPDEETQIKIIHQSIDQGWQGVFPLKERQYQNSQQKGLTSAIDSL